MLHGHNAYKSIAKQTLPPRELEASLLMKSASQLQAVYEGWDDMQDALGHALKFNRELWIVLVDSAVASENPLPQDIKNNIASLAVFIFNRTLQIEIKPEKPLLNVLISVNRNIAAGLLANNTNFQQAVG